jgi:tRNA G18 (ribose-2'-O)-methylase SpoU
MIHVKVPESIPYTTPASEFIYGTSAILSALKCSRRKLYRLYLFEGDQRESGSRDETLRKTALAAGVVVKGVSGDWIRLLDKMSGGRPHNGYVMEASPLPKLPVASYDRVASPSVNHFEVKLAHQSQEEEYVNGSNPRIPSLSLSSSPDGTTPRYPFTLLLDGILDPGNLGAIIRSAYYLGVDAVAFSARNSAPFSPVTIKASAGAAESIPLLSVTNTVAFVDTTRSNGWQFFAAEAPTSISAAAGQLRGRTTHVFNASNTVLLSDLSHALRESPCVLMLGGEGLGLSSNLRKRADSFVGIPGVRTKANNTDPAGVDSLNVSVASGLLCEAFLREPLGCKSENLAPPSSSEIAGDVVDEEQPGDAGGETKESGTLDENKIF